ncbi:MAG TPA: CpsB/CapC family capsule biosynthesis tyrosine phosphatase, partial [Polyangiaceae bacterium]|nr:CpsB/CapC family capsule biosynthesis tyrosine phosphatase [Polyangiaceae bacterium]
LIDLHCHFVAAIDDGAPNTEISLAMLRELRSVGFDLVVATPHMRPDLFDNRREDLMRAFDATAHALRDETDLPRTDLGCEHYFDEVVYERLMHDQGLPYPGGRAALVEFHGLDFPPALAERLFDLRRRGVLPVIAHPERYRCFWERPELLTGLVEAGCATLLDVAALVGKYGREPQRAAERILEEQLYHAACTDSHRPSDVAAAAAGIRWLEQRYGDDEVDFLFRRGPSALLAGNLPEA